MEIQTQSSVMPSQGSTAANTTAVAGNHAVHAAQDGKAGKTFADVMGNTLKGSDTKPTDEATVTMEALLQGFSPVLLLQLLQGQDMAQGTTEDTALKLEQLVNTLNQKPDALIQLVDSKGFQSLLKQVNDILVSMANDVLPEIRSTELLPSAIGSTDLAGKASLADISEGTMNVNQAQHILSQFMTTLQQNPDSLLLQQLAENIQDMLSPLVDSQNKTNDTSAGSNEISDLVSNDSKLKHANTTSGVLQKLNVVSDFSQNATKSNHPDSVFASQQLLQGNKQASKLDVLSVKSGAIERMMLSTLGTVTDSSEDSTVDLTPQLTNTLPLQDLLRQVQNEQVKTTQPISAQNFVQDMSQFVLKNIKVDALNGFSEAKLTLSPEHLGQVDVKLTMHNGQLVAHFAAQTALGKELLESQLAQLRSSLQNQGVQVERIEVTQNNSLQSSLFQEQKQQQFAQQFSQQNKGKYNDAEQDLESFSAELATIAQLRSVSSGNAFDVTA